MTAGSRWARLHSTRFEFRWGICAGEYQSLLVTTGAAYDIRFVIATGAGSTVTSPTDNFVADTNPFLIGRQKELIQAAGTQKSQDIRATFGAPAGIVGPVGPMPPSPTLREQPYPLVLSEYEGIIIQVEPGNVGLADISIAMSTGTDVAIAAGAITLLHGDVSRIAEAILLGRSTLATIRQNLVWAFGYNVVAIPIAMAALLNPILNQGLSRDRTE